MDILSRKDQVDIKDNNKNIQILKEEVWIRKTTVEITILRKSKMTENSDLLEKI